MLEFVIMDPPKTNLQFKSFWSHVLAINKASTKINGVLFQRHFFRGHITVDGLPDSCNLSAMWQSVFTQG